VIREGLGILVGEGLVAKEQGRGTFVKAFDCKRLETDPTFPSFSNRADIYVLRVAVEMAAAGIAAENATDEDLAKLEEIADIGEPEVKQGMMAYEMRFHQALLRASHNPTLQQFRDLISESLRLKAYDINVPIFGEEEAKGS